MANIQVTTKVGSLELINSEVVHISNNTPIEIAIQNLTLVLEFIKDASHKGTGLRTDVENNILYLKCINFSNSIGEGIVEPLEVGNLGGQKLFISFFVFTPSVEQGRRVVNYSLYLG